MLYFLSANRAGHKPALKLDLFGDALQDVIRPNGFTTPLQLVTLHVGRLEGDVKVTQPKTDRLYTLCRVHCLH